MPDKQTAKKLHHKPLVGQPGAKKQPNNTGEIKRFVSRFTDEEKMLVLLKNELYEGSWTDMLEDLKNRLEGKPYIFKLANRIKDDIARIEQLLAFEKKHHIDLANFIETPKP